MDLNRSLIKSQAKELIKGNVFKFFLIIFVVSLLTGGVTGAISSVSNASDYVNDLTSGSRSEEGNLENSIDEYDFDDFGENGEINDFDVDQFTNDIIGGATKPSNIFVNSITTSLSSFSGIIGLFLAPLSITLAGVFYALIKGRKMDWSEEFEYVFSKTFDKNYFNKFLLNLMQIIFTALWSLLFIIPGIVYSYKIYFTSFIMAEKPELSWKEAIEISKKMTDGHKGELFVLDLSFIGWYCLEVLTLGIVGIYVLPYVYTTKALYYENFKIRAFQLGAMNEYDFLTEKEKFAMANGGAEQAQGYQPVQNNVYQPVESPVTNYEPPVAAPVAEAPAPSEPIIETPIVEAPVAEETVAEAPAVEQPITEAPVIEETVAEAPATDGFEPEAPTELLTDENSAAE